MTASCPVCATQVPQYQFEHPNGARIECPVCGTYRILERAYQLLGERRQYTEHHVILPDRRLSAALRQEAERGKEPVLDDPDVMARGYQLAADPLDVIDRILLYLRAKAPGGDKYVGLGGWRDYAVAGANSPEAFDYALGKAAEMGYVERKAPDEAAYRLTLAGWKHLRELPDVERTELLLLADRAVRVLYDLELHDGYSPEGLVDALGVDQTQVAGALRYAKKKGWVTTVETFDDQLPPDVSLTREGTRYAEGLLNTRPSQTPAASGTSNTTPIPAAQSMSRRVFVVHGHDDGAKNAVAYTLGRLRLDPVILHEQPSGGRTLIEKLVHYIDDVAFAVVVLTPDDVGAPRASPQSLSSRARQNVILELGLLIGKLGRERVCALVKTDVERPSDIAGVVYVDMDERGAWRSELGRELRNAGIDVDLNRL